MRHLSQYLLQHYRSLYIVLSILSMNRTVHSLCFWFHLLVAMWNYMVLKSQEWRTTGWFSCNYFNLHRYTLQWTKAQGWTASLFFLLLRGRKTLSSSNCRLFWFRGHLLQHRVKKVIFIFHQQTGYSYGAQELPWSSSHPQISLQPVNGGWAVTKSLFSNLGCKKEQIDINKL